MQDKEYIEEKVKIPKIESKTNLSLLFQSILQQLRWLHWAHSKLDKKFDNTIEELRKEMKIKVLIIGPLIVLVADRLLKHFGV